MMFMLSQYDLRNIVPLTRNIIKLRAKHKFCVVDSRSKVQVTVLFCFSSFYRYQYATLEREKRLCSRSS